MLPEKTRGTKQKTPVIKRNVNPQWNHTFVFEDVSLDDLRERSIELTIWDHDRFTSNDFLGGVRLNLGTGIVETIVTSNKVVYEHVSFETCVYIL